MGNMTMAPANPRKQRITIRDTGQFGQCRVGRSEKMLAGRRQRKSQPGDIVYFR
jgi:hypothetical protein